MLFQIKSYIRFLLKSTNQHGVHSPFVYDLVTKCFYTDIYHDKIKEISESHNLTKLSKKRSDLLIKIIDYLKPKAVLEVEKSTKTLPELLSNTTFGMIYFDVNHQKQPTIDYFEQSLESINNNSVFIFDNIHRSKEMSEAWETIKNHKKVSVTIDTYIFGIVFFRKEQEKEHFIIRV